MNIPKIFLICVLIYEVAGETCLTDYGEVGECINIHNCSSFLTLIEKGQKPKICRFEKIDAIICCTKDQDKTKNQEEKKIEEENKHLETKINTEGEFPPGCYNVWMKNKDIKFVPPTLGVGGIASRIKEFPYMAALGYDGENNETAWACGGTLITTQHVLTAAHCLHNINMGKVKYVRLGDLNLRLDLKDEAPQQYRIIKSFPHPDYHPPAPYNDIGIIKLEKPCYINPYVIPACLNTYNVLPRGFYSATGWGQLGYGENVADHLQKMIIRIFNHTECGEAYKNISKRRLHKGIDKETQVCAGAPNVDTCPGDSGGPLQHESMRNIVFGVTSFGVACGISVIPGVYIKVSPFIPWIKSIILP